MWKVSRTGSVRTGTSGSLEVRRGIVRGERRRHRFAALKSGIRDEFGDVCFLVQMGATVRDLELDTAVV